MTNIYRVLSIFLCTTVLWGCTQSDDEIVANPKTDGTSEAIQFMASTETSKLTTYAIGDFPNSGRIGVVAAFHQSPNLDWTSIYGNILNAGATASASGTGDYSFVWDAPHYWPFDTSSLGFLAYSPVAEATGAVVLNNDKSSLTLRLQDNMPDVLYASENQNATAYNRSATAPVNLGEFRHALSQLTIQVKADAVTNVDLIKLEVVTSNRTATLDLLAGDDGIDVEDDDIFAYNLVTGKQDIITSAFKKTVLLYPTTEDVTQINLILKEQDGAELEYPISHMMTFFENTANPSIPITLQRAKNTTLNIRVKSRGISTPSLMLEAEIVDWIPKGNFGIIIK